MLHKGKVERPAASGMFFDYIIHKNGGTHVPAAGEIMEADSVYHTVTMAKGTVIDVKNIT